MARAGKVKGIRPKRPLSDNARRIIETRMKELLRWREAVQDSSRTEDLHNMRIAAKRVRYALELFHICFADVDSALSSLVQLQQTLGEIHDLDVLADIMRQRLASVDRSLQEEAAKIMQEAGTRSDKNNRLRGAMRSASRERDRLGILGLLGAYVMERQRLFASCQSQWLNGSLDALAADVRTAIGVAKVAAD